MMRKRRNGNAPRGESLVAVVGGSKSDLPILEKAMVMLSQLGVPAELRILSAHRTPDHLLAYVQEAADRGITVFIAGAGGAAHLAGVIAANTHVPVIGLPIPTDHLRGLDSLLSIVQMPKGVPVATVAIGGAENAGLLAAQILGVHNGFIRGRVKEFRAAQTRAVLESSPQYEAKPAKSPKA